MTGSTGCPTDSATWWRSPGVTVGPASLASRANNGKISTYAFHSPTVLNLVPAIGSSRVPRGCEIPDVAADALVALADSGPEYDPFDSGFSLANHGPIVVDALLALGRDDNVIP